MTEEKVYTSHLGQIGDFLIKFFSYVIMTVFALLTIYPLIWLMINSLKPTPEFQISKLSFPASPTFANYTGAWKIGDFDKLIGNSLIYTIGTTIGVIFLSVLAGFAFAKIKRKATKPLYASFIIGLTLTTQSLMIPLFLEANLLHIYNTRFAVLLIYIGSGLPMGLYLCTEFIKSVPDSLVESSRIDGAGYFRIFLSIILPMTVPVITVLAILNITATWNEFALINILVSKTELKSLPLGINKFSGTLSSDYGKQFAALTVGMLPMLVFYLIFRKQITKGVAAGAVKG
jgi:raffinose/stachyose/melibiose transport system permease protein